MNTENAIRVNLAINSFTYLFKFVYGISIITLFL